MSPFIEIIFNFNKPKWLGLVGTSFEYPITSAPSFVNHKVSHEPLNPV